MVLYIMLDLELSAIYEDIELHFYFESKMQSSSNFYIRYLRLLALVFHLLLLSTSFSDDLLAFAYFYKI